jgi:hypothetical protein
MRYTIIVIFIIISFITYFEFNRLKQAKVVNELYKVQIMEIKENGRLSQKEIDLKIKEEKENFKEDSPLIIKKLESNKIELKSIQEKMILDINEERDRELKNILKHNVILNKLN